MGLQNFSSRIRIPIHSGVLLRRQAYSRPPLPPRGPAPQAPQAERERRRPGRRVPAADEALQSIPEPKAIPERGDEDRRPDGSAPFPEGPSDRLSRQGSDGDLDLFFRAIA